MGSRPNLVTDSTGNRNAINSFPKAGDLFHTVLQHSGLFLEPVCRSRHGLNVNRHNTQRQGAELRAELCKGSPGRRTGSHVRESQGAGQSQRVMQPEKTGQSAERALPGAAAMRLLSI